MIPTVISIPIPFLGFSIPIHSFGLMMVAAFLASWRLLEKQLQVVGEKPELAERLVFAAAVGGIVGARIGYILSYPAELMRDPLGMIFSGAGFVFYGGFIGGLLSVTYILRKEKKSFFSFGDYVAPSLALGYGIGRIGCQLSGDGDYGYESDLPWAMGYPLGVVPTPLGVLVHPTPVYETLAALLVVLLLLSPFTRKIFSSRPGGIFGLYLILSAVLRFLVEFLRVEPIIAIGFTQAQLVSVALFAFGGWLMMRRVNR